MFPDNDRFGFLGLKSPIARRIHKQVAVVGGIVTLLLAGSEAYLAYQASTSSALEHVASIGRLIAPSLAQNLWEFDLNQVHIQLNALVDTGDIDTVLLRQDSQPEIKLGAERLSGSTREQTIPLLYLEEGKQQQLGNLILISDLNKSQKKALVHALLLATEIFSLVVLFITGS
jgi:Periplasmic sensor domain found in signal transduction proteins